MTYAARFNSAGAVDLAVVPQATNIGSSLVMPPGLCTYNGVTYDCATEGLYRWLAVNTDTTNRIVDQSDICAAMSGLSWLVEHGRGSGVDEALTVQQMEERTKSIKLRLRCGPTVDFCRHLLTGRGLTTRLVRHLTMQSPAAPWSGVDEGHVTMEKQSSANWLDFDPNNAAYYRNGAGEHLGAREIVTSIANDGFQIVPLDADSGYEVMPFEPGNRSGETSSSITLSGNPTYSSRCQMRSFMLIRTLLTGHSQLRSARDLFRSFLDSGGCAPDCCSSRDIGIY